MPDLDWAVVADELGQRRTTSLRTCLVGYQAVAQCLETVDSHLDGKGPLASVRATLGPAMTAVSADPSAENMLATAFYGIAMEAWEGTLSWSDVGAVIDTVQAAWREHPPAQSPLTDLIYAYLPSVREAMMVENALNCSSPTMLAESAAVLVRRASESLDQLSTLTQEPTSTLDPEAVRCIRGRFLIDRTYFAALRDMAVAVAAFLTPVPDASTALAAAEAALAVAEGQPQLRSDVYASELRAHRLTLRAHAATFSLPRLHVAEARVRYCYPFTAPGSRPEFVLRTVREEGAGWSPGGCAVRTVRAMPLSDMWESADPRGMRYEGIQVVLPPISITTGREELTGSAELCFTSMGQHFLRIHTVLADAGLHDVNQALRRPSYAMGFERTSSEGGHWSNLAEYAEAVIASVLSSLQHGLDSTDDGWRGASHGARLSAGRTFHTIMSIRELLKVLPDGGQEHVHGEALLDPDVLGTTLFLHQVRGTAVALEEWVRYPHVSVENAFAGLGFEGDVVLRTGNTTVLALTGLPSYRIEGYEEGAEFLVGLPLLVRDWQTRVVDFVSSVRAELTESTVAHGGDLRRVPILEQRQLQLRTLVAGIRADVAFIESPYIVRSAGSRQYLDRLSAAAGMSRQLQDLNSQIDQAESLYDGISAVVQVIEEKQQRRLRRGLELVLGVIAATSLADMFALANSTAAAPPGWLVWGELAVVVLCALLIAYYVLSSFRTSGVREADRGRRAAG